MSLEDQKKGKHKVRRAKISLHGLGNQGHGYQLHNTLKHSNRGPWVEILQVILLAKWHPLAS